MANTIDEIIILDSDGEDKVEESPTKEQMITETTVTNSNNEAPTQPTTTDQRPQQESTDSAATDVVLKRIKVESDTAVIEEPVKEIAQEAAKKSEETVTAEKPANAEEQKTTDEPKASESQPVQSNQKAAEQKMEVDVQENEKEKNCLWITNLAITTKASELKAMFGEFGKVTSARIFTTKNATNPTCFGSVSMQNAACASQAKLRYNRSNLHGKLITIEMVSQTPTATRPIIPAGASASKPESTDQKTSTNETFATNQTSKAEVPKDSSNTKTENKPSEKEAKSSRETTKKSSAPKESKKSGETNKVPIKAPETSKSSKSNDQKQTRRDNFKSRRVSTKQSTSRQPTYRDSNVSRSNISSRRSATYQRANPRDSRDGYSRGVRSGGRFGDRNEVRSSTQYRAISPRRNFVEPAFSRPVITTSHEQLFSQQQILEMKREAERAQKHREAALETQRRNLQMDLERSKFEREKVELEREKERVEMEKLKLELRQARENELKAQRALTTITQTTKSTGSTSTHNRDYSSSTEKRRSPRADVHRNSTSSSHRRSRSPHRTQISHRSSSTRDRKPAELYYDSPHKTSSRSRPEEPKSRSSHRSSTHQSSQFSGYVHSSSSSRSAVPQSASLSSYAPSSYPTNNPAHHHSRIEQSPSKEAMYEKRLNDMCRGTNTATYGRTIDNYGSSSYNRSEMNTRYASNLPTDSYSRTASAYDQQYPQSYSASTSAQQHTSWPAPSFSYDAQTIPNWRNPSAIASTNAYNNLDKSATYEYMRRF